MSDYLLVFLHGHDDEPGPYLDQLRGIVPAHFSVEAPRGPLPGAGSGASWFDTIDGEANPSEVGAALDFITKVVNDASHRHAVAPDHVVVGGFSQGAALALAWVLRDGSDPPPIAGLMVIAGWLPDVAGLTYDLDRARDLPVFFGHGDDDDVVAPSLARSVGRVLDRQGAKVTWFAHPGAHVFGPVIPSASTWLSAFGSPIVPPAA